MSKKKTNEEYVLELSVKRPEYIAREEYVTASIKIIHKHLVCGHEWLITPNKILSGRGCPRCSNGRKTTEEYKQQIPEAYEPLENYINNYTPILHRHIACGHEWLAYPNSILKGSGCPNCANIKRTKTIEQYKKQIPEAYELLEPYINNYTPILHRHIACGYEWRVAPTSILQGYGCPVCATSGFNPEKPATLYYICINEKYYKIGITGKTVQERFQREKDVIIRLAWSQKFEKGSDAFLMEKEIKNTH